MSLMAHIRAISPDRLCGRSRETRRRRPRRANNAKRGGSNDDDDEQDSSLRIFRSDRTDYRHGHNYARLSLPYARLSLGHFCSPLALSPGELNSVQFSSLRFYSLKITPRRRHASSSTSSSRFASSRSRQPARNFRSALSVEIP